MQFAQLNLDTFHLNVYFIACCQASGMQVFSMYMCIIIKVSIVGVTTRLGGYTKPFILKSTQDSCTFISSLFI